MIKKSAVILFSVIFLATTAFAYSNHPPKNHPTELVPSDSPMKLNNYDIKGSSIGHNTQKKMPLSHHDTSDYKK